MAYVGDLTNEEISFIIDCIDANSSNPVYNIVKPKLEEARRRAAIQEEKSTNWFFNSYNYHVPLKDLIDVPEDTMKNTIREVLGDSYPENMAARIVNSLHRQGIIFISDVLEKTPAYLQGTRNLGFSSQKILAECLWALKKSVSETKVLNQDDDVQVVVAIDEADELEWQR